MCFNDNGECTQLTVGYVMDKTLGNTGGLGGVYGILYAIGYGESLFIFIGNTAVGAVIAVLFQIEYWVAVDGPAPGVMLVSVNIFSKNTE